MEYQILTDSIADLPSFWAEKYPEVATVEMPVIAVKAGHREVEFKGLTADTFMDAHDYVKQGYTTRTSLPVIYESAGEADVGVMSVERLTKQYLDAGKDVIYLALNSAISGVYANVSVMYEELALQYPERKLIVVDTECASTGLAMLIMDLCAAELATVRQAEEFVLRQRSHIAHIFTWFDFTYIVRSGKVKSLAAVLGKILGFHPIGSEEYAGDGRPLVQIGLFRGKFNFIDKLARLVMRTMVDPEGGPVIIAHGNCEDKALMIREAILGYLPKATIYCGPQWRCGAAIQAHGGPSSIHINYHRQPMTYEETLKIVHEL